jgi:hypothetical protein
MWSLLEFFPEPFLVNVIDIGAALNERPPYQSLVEAGRARLIGFEPNQAECDRLNRAFGPPHAFYPKFIGDGRPAVFHETNVVYTGSLYEPITPLLEKFQNLSEVVRPVAKHPVETTRLDDVAAIEDADFIKIDVQGAELSVFENALRVLSQTLLVQVEVEFVELYRGQPMFADIDIFLRRQGFQFHTFNGFCGRTFKPLIVGGNLNVQLRQDLWTDAIYVRDWMRLDELTVNKLRNFAVLAHDVLGSYDLVHLLLTALDRKTGGNLAPAYMARLSSTPQPGGS